MKDANGHAGGLHTLEFGLLEMATDNSQAVLILEDAVDWRVGHRVNAAERFVGVVGDSGGIPQEEDKKDK